MKKRILLVVFVVSVFYVTDVQAQGCKQNMEIKQNLSLFNEDAKAKRYDAAYPIWKSVYEKCPSISVAVFIRGEAILKHKIANSKGAAEKEQFIKDLSKLYEDYNKYFPSRYGVANKYVDQAMLAYDQKTGTSEEIYALLHKAFTEDRVNFKNEKALYLYFSELVTLYEKNKKTLQDVFDAYELSSLRPFVLLLDLLK